MPGVCVVLFLWCGSAALRLGTEPADGHRTFNVTVKFSKPSFVESTTLPVSSGEEKGDLVEGEPKEFTGLAEGEIVTVGATSSDSSTCSYKAGQKMTVCFLNNMCRVVFKSHGEVKERLGLHVLVKRTGSGMGSFDVHINNVTKYNSGMIPSGSISGRILPADAGDVATVLFHSTNTPCTYTVARGYDKDTSCKLDGWETEFETFILKPYTPGWKTHLLIEGRGPTFDILLDDDKKYTEDAHFTSVSCTRSFDTKLNQTVTIRFGGGIGGDYTYRVSNEGQIFKNLKGYNIDLKTIPKGSQN